MAREGRPDAVDSPRRRSAQEERSARTERLKRFAESLEESSPFKARAMALARKAEEWQAKPKSA